MRNSARHHILQVKHSLQHLDVVETLKAFSQPIHGPDRCDESLALCLLTQPPQVPCETFLSFFFHPFLFLLLKDQITTSLAPQPVSRQVVGVAVREHGYWCSFWAVIGWLVGGLALFASTCLSFLDPRPGPQGTTVTWKSRSWNWAYHVQICLLPQSNERKKRQKESEVGRCSRRGNVSLFYSSRWSFKGLNARLGRFQLLILQVGHGGLIALCFKGGWVPFVISLFNHHIMF